MAPAFLRAPRRILFLLGLSVTALSAHAGWTSAPPGSASLNASVSVSATGSANPGNYPISYLIIWAQSPSGTWTPVATGTGTNSSTINNSGSKTLDASGTWNWELRLATSGPSGSPNGTLIASATTSVAAPPTSTSFSFSNLSHTYNGSTKTASVTPNPANATYTADLTKGPGVGSYTVSATATGSFTGSGSATLVINAAPDTTAPSTPGNVHVTAFDQSSVTFAWNASSDNVGVTGYQVRLNQGSSVTASGLSYTFTGLANNTNYLLQVQARDAAGNWSGWGGATASTGGAGGGGSGSGTSFWLDVNGDGIRDEVVKAGTTDFNYAIDWWYSNDPSTWGLAINSFWTPQNIFNPDSGSWWNNHIIVWFGEANMGTSTTTSFGVTFSIVPRPGRQMSIFMDPSNSSTANPAIWQPMQLNMGPIGLSTFTYSQPFATTGSLDGTSFFLAHLGTPVASLQFNDSLGNVLIDSVAVNGTANLFLPANNQIALGVRDTVGFLSTSTHAIVWKILDAVGNVLRQGTGLNVDFDSLSDFTQLSVTLDLATIKLFSLNRISINASDGQIDVLGNFVSATSGSAKHFVTPQKTAEIANDYVEFYAKGLSAGDFATNGPYEWQFTPTGVATVVPNEGYKFRVPRDTARKVEAKLVRKNDGKVMDSCITWVVWATISSGDTPIASHAVLVRPGRAGTAVDGGYTFQHTIAPANVITDTDRPDLSGTNQTAPPGGNHWTGNPLSGGADKKWDNSRQIRLKTLNPASLPSTAFALPLFPVDIPSYPTSPVEGNDDAIVNDEANDPYAASGVLSGQDKPGFALANDTGADGNTFELRLHFIEFTRLEIKKKWYRISADYPWRIHIRFKKVSGTWTDDTTAKALDNTGW